MSLVSSGGFGSTYNSTQLLKSVIVNKSQDIDNYLRADIHMCLQQGLEQPENISTALPQK